MTTYHGFVDESVRRGWYRLTVVRVRTADLAAISREVRTAIPPARVRIHLSKERPNTRRQILRACSRLAVIATVHETPHTGGNDQPARDRCLNSLVERLDDEPLAVLILDTRGPDRDKLDRTTLAKAIGDKDLHYAHRGSRDEPLLALPDAIGWAVGAGAPFAGIVGPVTSRREC